jgi:hypothetical protein
MFFRITRSRRLKTIGKLSNVCEILNAQATMLRPFSFVSDPFVTQGDAALALG